MVGPKAQGQSRDLRLKIQSWRTSIQRTTTMNIQHRQSHTWPFFRVSITKAVPQMQNDENWTTKSPLNLKLKKTLPGKNHTQMTKMKTPKKISTVLRTRLKNKSRRNWTMKMIRKTKKTQQILSTYTLRTPMTILSHKESSPYKRTIGQRNEHYYTI